MSETQLLLLLMICLVGMMSPGPDFLIVTKNSLLYSRRQALATAFGVVTGHLVHASYCVFGLVLIITKSLFLYSTIKYLGACYLIYLGLKSLVPKSAKKTNVSDLKTAPQISTRSAFVQGFLCNVLNPKLAVFLLSLFTQFITAEASFFEKATVAGVFVIEGAIYWPLLVILLQSGAVQKTLTSFQKHLDRVCGVLLIYLGATVALSSTR